MPLVLLPVGLTVAAVVEEIVAKVNNRIITKSEFEERGQAVLKQIYQNYFGEDLDRELQLAQDDLLANLITEQLLMERAETIFDVSKIRASLIDDFRSQQNIPSDEELQRLLDEQGMSRAELEDQLMRLALPQEIVNYDVRRKISVSEREIQEYYDTHSEEWETAPTVTIREIVLLYDSTTRDDVEGKLEEVMRELEKGVDFVDLVKQYSEAGTREADGLLGPLTRDDLHPALAGTAFSLEVGEVSDPIDTGRSFHVIKIQARTPLLVKRIDEVRDAVQDKVRQSKFLPKYRKYLRKLWRENEIEVMPKYEHYLVNTPLETEPGA